MPSRSWDYKRSIFRAIGRRSAKGPPALSRRPLKLTSLAKEKGLLALLLVFLLFAERIGVLATLFVLLLLFAKGADVATFLLILLLFAVHNDVAALLLVLLFLTRESWGAERHCHCHCHDCHQYALHNVLLPIL